MNRQGRTCAMRSHFPIEQVEQGIGPCNGYEGSEHQVQPYVRYDAPFCVLFRRAADVGPRLRFVERQIQLQGEVA